jgi:hypothetical protein
VGCASARLKPSEHIANRTAPKPHLASTEAYFYFMRNKTMTEFQPVSWERPLSAQLGKNPELMFVEVVDKHAPLQTEYPALEDYPGVRDVDRMAGVVRLEDGRTQSIGNFLGHHATVVSMDVRQ